MTFRLLGLLGGILLATAASSAAAQTQFDANCQTVTYTEDQLFEQEVCKSHAGCAMIFAGGQKFCKGVDFLRHIGDRLTGTKPLNNDDILEATEPDYPKSSFTSRIMSKVKSITNAVFDSRPESKIYLTQDGSTAYAETLPSGSGRRAGAIIVSNGMRERGQFADDLGQTGYGEKVLANGQIRAGDFRNGGLAGEGFKTEPNGRSTEVYEGTFDNDVPVGEVVHRFADGTSARELWQNGKMIERGRLAAKGGIPPHLESQMAAAGTSASSNSHATPSYALPANSGLSGVWRGDSSGNMVRLTKRPGGYDVAAAGGGQSLFYRERSDGSIVFTFPDGNQSIGQPLSDGSIRLSQPGFSDIFRRQ